MGPFEVDCHAGHRLRSVPKRKVAITIDEDLYEAVVRLADERDESLSAWISEAARLQAANAELGSLIDE